MRFMIEGLKFFGVFLISRDRCWVLPQLTCSVFLMPVIWGPICRPQACFLFWGSIWDPSNLRIGVSYFMSLGVAQHGYFCKWIWKSETFAFIQSPAEAWNVNAPKSISSAHGMYKKSRKKVVDVRPIPTYLLFLAFLLWELYDYPWFDGNLSCTFTPTRIPA